MARTYKIQIEIEHEISADEVAYPWIEVEYSYTRGSPAVYYQRNGDPGWPADPAEVEFVNAKLVKAAGLNPSQADIDAWAEKWLASDAGYREAVENAEYREEA